MHHTAQHINWPTSTTWGFFHPRHRDISSSLITSRKTLLPRQLWKKALYQQGKVSKELMAHTPVSLHISLLHYLSAELAPVVSRQHWQKNTENPPEKSPSNVSWMNYASLMFLGTQVMARLVCSLAHVRNESSTALPTTFAFQTASIPADFPTHHHPQVTWERGRHHGQKHQCDLQAE